MCGFDWLLFLLSRFILRASNRWILNTQAIVRLIIASGIVGNLLSDMVSSPNLLVAHFEGMPFHVQVDLMRRTDILIIPHGAGITNLIFLQVRFLPTCMYNTTVF